MEQISKYDKRREELLNAVENFTKQYGWDNFTVRDICDYLGIGIGTFYHYFSGKDTLFIALFSPIDDALEKCTKEFTNDEISNIMLFCKTYSQYCVKSGLEICRNIYGSTVLESKPPYNSEDRPIFIILNSCIKRGLEKDQIPESLDALWLTRTILVFLRGYSGDWARYGASYDLVGNMEKHMTFFLKGILSEKTA